MDGIRTLGRYRLDTLLGSGPHADTYQATDTIRRRTVAVKIFRSGLFSNRHAYTRFAQIAQTSADLVHPYIAWLWETGEQAETYFLIERFIDGKNLAEFLATEGPLAWETASGLFRQAAQALTFAHTRGIPHGSLKSQNLLVSRDRSAVLTDFRLAQALQAGGVATPPGGIAYIAPEIWQGQAANPLADQYALACLLYEMVTGDVLFKATTLPAAAASHLELPTLPSEWPTDIPNKIGDFLRQALATDPTQRFSNLTEAVTAIDRLRPKPISIALPSEPKPAQRPTQKAQPAKPGTKTTDRQPNGAKTAQAEPESSDIPGSKFDEAVLAEPQAPAAPEATQLTTPLAAGGAVRPLAKQEGLVGEAKTAELFQDQTTTPGQPAVITEPVPDGVPIATPDENSSGIVSPVETIALSGTTDEPGEPMPVAMDAEGALQAVPVEAPIELEQATPTAPPGSRTKGRRSNSFGLWLTAALAIILVLAGLWSSGIVDGVRSTPTHQLQTGTPRLPGLLPQSTRTNTISYPTATSQVLPTRKASALPSQTSVQTPAEPSPTIAGPMVTTATGPASISSTSTTPSQTFPTPTLRPSSTPTSTRTRRPTAEPANDDSNDRDADSRPFIPAGDATP